MDQTSAGQSQAGLLHHQTDGQLHPWSHNRAESVAQLRSAKDAEVLVLRENTTAIKLRGASLKARGLAARMESSRDSPVVAHTTMEFFALAIHEVHGLALQGFDAQNSLST